jgi:hypothetical protein
MKIKSFFSIITVLIIFSSCSVASKSKTSTVKTMDINNGGVYTKPLLADLEVKEAKVTATAKGTISKDGVDFVKNLAVANALKTNNGDILVEPKYDIETSGDDIVVVVSGFSANYKNMRQLKTEDSLFLKNRVMLNAGTSSIKTNESTSAGVEPNKKSNTGRTLLAILGLSILVSLLVGG